MGHCILAEQRRKKWWYISSHEGLPVITMDGLPVLSGCCRENETSLWERCRHPSVGRESVFTGRCFQCNKNCFQINRRLRWEGWPTFVLFFPTQESVSSLGPYRTFLNFSSLGKQSFSVTSAHVRIS